MENQTKYEGKGDVCAKPDGSRDHNLQRCGECGVLVHELCYGMVPTSAKDPNFTCHACRAAGTEVEVNVPSKVGGAVLRDVLAREGGIESILEYLRSGCGEENGNGGSSAERNLEFYASTTEFQSDDGVSGELFGESSLRQRAQRVFDAYCAKGAEKRVDLPSNVLSDIDSKIFGGDEDAITPTLFDRARHEALRSLEETDLFEKYRQSSQFRSFLAKHRTMVKQTDRPSECALCSVRTGVHAMHPLYDDHGGEGRQLVLPASGVGFMRRERRLAWVHTLCAMFISSSARTGGLVYGCNGDGEYEAYDDDEDADAKKEDAKKNRVIDSSASDYSTDEGDGNPTATLEEEQKNFTECERVFRPLMDRLQNASNGADDDAKDVLECIDSMIANIHVLTPPFVREYQIGSVVKGIKKSFEATHPEVRARCKLLSAEMRRVYLEKEKYVPSGFVPVKNLSDCKKEEDADPNQAGSCKDNVDPCSNTIEMNKYKVGTAVAKESDGRVHIGKVVSYDLETRRYRVAYPDRDDDLLPEVEVSKLLLSYTAWFCMQAEDATCGGEEARRAGHRVKSLRELTCVICKKRDNASKGCLRIPVQCSAGDRYEFEEFKQHHRELNGKRSKSKKRREGRVSCAEAMHVGCARWGSEYAKVGNRDLRMCFYFPGRPPTYAGDDGYPDPVSNCFCRVHAREVQEGQKKKKPSDGTAAAARKRKGPDGAEDSKGDVSSEHDSEDSEERARREQMAIAKKKRRRIVVQTDEESN